MVKCFQIHILILVCNIVSAKVRVPALFSDNMVLQQNSQVPFWGWSEPNAEITISCSWDNELYKVIADKNANWKTTIKTPLAGGPYTVTISESNTIILHHVMIGEVWLLSGQSNMEWTAGSGIDNKDLEIKNANHPLIHHIRIPKAQADQPQNHTNAEWLVCSPETMPGFSAVGYFFARELTQKLNIPIGLIHASWGGSAIEAWIPKEIIESDAEFIKWKELFPESFQWPYKPGSTYNAMIHPLIPFKIAGSLWYQGESNVSNPLAYRRLFPTMIDRWRKDWGYEFPFYYVQLAPFTYGRPLQGSLLQEAQLKTLNTSPKTGMAVIADVGNITDIHPRNKQEVGKRLALWALANTYNQNVSYSGPLYKSMIKESNKIKVFFDHTNGGLEIKNFKPDMYKISGENKQYVNATVDIEGDALVFSSDAISDPVAVRYGFTNTSEDNLYNKAGLPASPFRTDDWPVIYNDITIKSVYDPSKQGFVITMEGADKIVYNLEGKEPGINATVYMGPFVVKQKTDIKAKVITNDVLSENIVSKSILLSKSTYRPIHYVTAYSQKYNGTGNYTLINGQRSNSLNINDPEWQGWEENNMEIILDLGENQKIKNIGVSFLQDQNSKVFLPTSLEISTSVNNRQFITTYSQATPISNDRTPSSKLFTSPYNATARYIKIKATNVGTCPAWHTSANSKAILMADEITIE